MRFHPRLRLAAALFGAFALAGDAYAAKDDIPRLPSGKPDFSGIWQTTSAADYELEPHSGRAGRAAERGRRRRQRHSLPCPRRWSRRKRTSPSRDTKIRASSAGRSARRAASTTREPFQIFQRDRDLTLVFQFGHSVRTIHTNGTLHPGVTDNEFYLGDSRGHWEGDTLVVDVTDFNEETWLDRAGNFHSEACTSSSAGSCSTPTPSSTRRRWKIRRSSAAVDV